MNKPETIKQTNIEGGVDEITVNGAQLVTGKRQKSTSYAIKAISEHWKTLQDAGLTTDEDDLTKTNLMNKIVMKYYNG